MPYRPRTRCPRCKRLHSGKGRCPTCRAVDRTTSDQARGSAAARGYGHTHREQFRRNVLDRDHTCVICHTAPATVADHYPYSRRQLVAMGRDPDDPQFGRGLCADCDRTQTARRQPGGWADPTRPRD